VKEIFSTSNQLVKQINIETITVHLDTFDCDTVKQLFTQTNRSSISVIAPLVETKERITYYCIKEGEYIYTFLRQGSSKYLMYGFYLFDIANNENFFWGLKTYYKQDKEVTLRYLYSIFLVDNHLVSKARILLDRSGYITHIVRTINNSGKFINESLHHVLREENLHINTITLSTVSLMARVTLHSEYLAVVKRRANINYALVPYYEYE